MAARETQLARPLSLSAHGNDLAISGLALTSRHGQISGDVSRRGAALSLQLKGHDLDIASFTRLAGHNEAGGTLGFDANVGGTLAARKAALRSPERDLRFALPKQRLPTLSLDLNGNWNGGEISLSGHVRGLKGDALTISGEAPLVLAIRSGYASYWLVAYCSGNGGDECDLLVIGRPCAVSDGPRPIELLDGEGLDIEFLFRGDLRGVGDDGRAGRLGRQGRR